MTGLAAVFPGQGAQSIGMLSDLAEAYPVVKERFAEASEAISLDLWQLAQEGPAEALSATQNTQPVLLAASVAVWSAWQSVEGSSVPNYLAGHSLGEYSALVCAGSLKFADAVRLVRLRGQLMEAAVPRGQGGMAAIMGLDDPSIVAACDATEGVVCPANYNAPGQTVIAGEAGAVQAAAEACKAAGAKRAVVLDVSGPFHSPLMSAAKDEFALALADTEIQIPQIPVVQNVDAAIAPSQEALRENLLEQIAAPVQWAASVQTMVDLGVSQFVECGPGKVLAGLIRRISKPTPTIGLADPDGIEQSLALSR